MISTTRTLTGFAFLAGYIVMVGAASFLQKFGMKQLNPYQINFLMAVGMLVTAVPALWLTQGSLTVPTKALPLGAPIGLLMALGSISYVLALSKLPVGTAAIYDAIKVTEQPAQMKVIGTEKIGDREAYVAALAVEPKTTKLYFFDTQAGLLLRQTTTTSTMIAPLAEQVDFEDYREVDGVKLPFTIRSSDVDAFSPTTRRFTEIRHDGAVDNAIFNQPTAPK